MTNLFTYGTLMYEDVMFGLCQEKYQYKKSLLKGYQRKHLKARCYPGLVKSSGESVWGIVYLNVSPKDLETLHSY